MTTLGWIGAVAGIIGLAIWQRKMGWGGTEESIEDRHDRIGTSTENESGGSFFNFTGGSDSDGGWSDGGSSD